MEGVKENREYPGLQPSPEAGACYKIIIEERCRLTGILQMHKTENHETIRQVNSVDVLINPVCIRFSFFEGDIFYHFAAHSDAQLDRMERFMGIEPSKCAAFTDANLGFLPVASTVLILKRIFWWTREAIM